MKDFVLSAVEVLKVSHVRTDEMQTQINVRSVLTSGEAAKLHVQQNGYRSVQLTRSYKNVEVKLIPPKELGAHALKLWAERAANFTVKNVKAKDGKPAQQILHFSIYATGEHLEAVDFMKKIALGRLEVAERQAELFEKPEEASPVKRKRGRPPKVAADGKMLAAGEKGE